MSKVRIFSIASIFCLFTVFATLLFAGETLTDSKIGTKDGYGYELWYDNKGTVSMTIGEGGAFSCKWENVGNVLCRRGTRLYETYTHEELGKIKMKYNAIYEPRGNSYLSVYGWTTDPLVEYYIVDSWGNWRPPGANSKGTIKVDGGVYDIYETTRTNQPSIRGRSTFQQYWSVRRKKRSKGIINVTKHFKKWEKMGMKMGKMYEAAFVVEGYESSGKADVNKFILYIKGKKIPEDE